MAKEATQGHADEGHVIYKGRFSCVDAGVGVHLREKLKEQVAATQGCELASPLPLVALHTSAVTVASRDILSHNGCIVVTSPHAVTRVTSKLRAPPQLQPVRTRGPLQFVIIIKGLTPEASMPLFTPPS
ncbi:hypothetical protein Baya_2785 [Bagarius yarrelli]|uniref:Uncharacterized protein n=1 Tax=Bagarius yarrelli TaxID=175774 RepID=A0A556TQJ1_BAGYA|nr:hypothetical protein Baya_2785 [Bagarius yarrelli]